MPQFTDYPIAGSLTSNSIFLIVDPEDGKTKQTTAGAISGLSGDGCCNLQATLDVGATAVTPNIVITGDFHQIGKVRMTTIQAEGGSIEDTTVGTITPNTVKSTTLDASGATNLADVLNVTGATTLSSTLTVSAATQLNDTLSVANSSIFTGTVTTIGGLNVGGHLDVTGTFANSNSIITGGTINGAIIGATVPAAGTFSSLTVSGPITSGGNIDVNPGSSVVVDPAAPGGDVIAMEVGTNTNVNITAKAPSVILPPNQWAISADGGIIIDPGTGDNVVISNQLIEYDALGVNNSSADITAALPGIVLHKGWVETLEANRTYDLAGFAQGYLNVAGGIAIGGATAAAGTSLDIQTTEGIGLPSLTTVEEGVLQPTIAKAGTIWYNEDQKNTMISTAAASVSLLSQPYTPVSVNAGSTPYTMLSGENFVTCDTSLVPIDVILPLAVNTPAGMEINFKDTALNAQTNNITISPAGGNTIDSAGAVTISSNGGYYKFQSDGVTNWMIVDYAMPSPVEHIFTGTLTAAQIQVLNGTPVIVIPTVVGKIPVIKHVNLTLHAGAGTVAYNNVSLQLESTSGVANLVPMYSYDCLSYPIGIGTPNLSMPPNTPVADGTGVPTTPAQYVGSNGVQFTASGATGLGDWDIDYFITAYYI